MQQNTVVIRKATADDIDSILHVLATAFTSYEKDYPPQAYLETVLNEDLLRTRMEEMNVLVAEVDDEIVGTIAWGSVSSDEAHLRGMALVPASQGSGIASHLLNAAEMEARKAGHTLMSLDTAEVLKRSQRFYEKSGYRRTGRTPVMGGLSLVEYVKDL